MSRFVVDGTVFEGYCFRTYLAEGREYFDFWEQIPFQTQRKQEIDFPFPESLTSFLYLDAQKLEALCHDLGKAVQRLFEEKDRFCAAQIQKLLDELAKEHIYFVLLQLRWHDYLEQAREQHYENLRDLLPVKELTQLPSDVDTMQKQIRLIFEKVLDVENGKTDIPGRMAALCQEEKNNSLTLFRFSLLQTRSEAVDSKTFTEVLYPNTVRDLVDYTLRECIRREQKMRVCKNCGRYFALTGRVSAEYCSRVIDEKGHTCKDVGAVQQWTRSRADDRVFKAYRREYKRRFAWIKAGRITQEEFYAWSEAARQKKMACDAGELSLEEFEAWLAN